MSAKQVYLQENDLVQTTGGQNLEIRFQSKYYKESLHILLKSVLIVSLNLESYLVLIKSYGNSYITFLQYQKRINI